MLSLNITLHAAMSKRQEFSYKADLVTENRQNQTRPSPENQYKMATDQSMRETITQTVIKAAKAAIMAKV